MSLFLSQPPRRIYGIIVLALCIFWLSISGLVMQRAYDIRTYSKLFHLDKSLDTANQTLGFQQVIAISSEIAGDPAAWRQRGVIEAANRTGLLLHIENTTDVAEAEVIRIMKAGKGAHPSRGQAQAWVAHERVLRKIVDQKITSSLILEDDVDWELDIKSMLAPSGRVASAIRRLSASPDELELSLWPYGNTFDVIWLGHCGFRPHTGSSHFNITFPDEAVLPTSQLRVWDKKPFTGVEEGHRQVRLGSEVVCSFGYGITWQAAARLLKRLADGGTAFDVELDNTCTYGALRCLSVIPEVMHTQEMLGGRGSLIAEVNNQLSAGQQPSTPNTAPEVRPVTSNIRYSARCNAGQPDSQRKQCLPQG